MATLTTVLSMKAMLEARIVAVRIHGPASGLHGAATLPDRMRVSSQGALICPYVYLGYLGLFGASSDVCGLEVSTERVSPCFCRVRSWRRGWDSSHRY